MRAALALVLAAAPTMAPVPAAQLRGEPAIEAGKQLGVYLWTNGKGLHVRLSSNGKPVLFSGSIETDKPAGEFARVRKGAGGWVDRVQEKALLFSATVRAEIDGFDLALTPGTTVKVFLQIDGQQPEPAVVFVGGKLENPVSVPLRFTFSG